MAFKDCVNDGKITGWSYVGGLVGQIQSNGDSTMTLSDCINNGNVTGSSDYIGGLLGYIGREKKHGNCHFQLCEQW